MPRARLTPAAAALAAALVGLTAAHAATRRPLTDPAAPEYSWPAPDVDRDGVFDRVDRCPGTSPGAAVDAHGCALGGGGAARARLASSTRADLSSRLIEDGTLRLENVFFRTNGTELHPRARAVLLEIAEELRRHPRLKFEVCGHADERGTAEYNRWLSRARAREVRRFLAREGRVREMQLAARGYGETQPRVSGRTARALQANRRVELRLLNPEALAAGVRVERPALRLASASR